MREKNSFKFGKTEFTEDADTGYIGMIVWMGTKNHEKAEKVADEMIDKFNSKDIKLKKGKKSQ